MKFKSVILFSLMSLIIMSSGAYASGLQADNTPVAFIHGFVYEDTEDGRQLLSGVDVSIECMTDPYVGNTVTTQTVYGYYTKSLNCPMGGTVKVTASDDTGVLGVNTGVITQIGLVAEVDIGISRVDVGVPEFSAIIIPFLLSLAGFAIVRGKSLIQTV